MDEFTKNAIMTAIRTEKESHDFYLLAASRVDDPAAREFFIKLAGEEFGHLAAFIRLYPGGEREVGKLVDGVLTCKDHGCRELIRNVTSLDSRTDALCTAIKEEQSCIDLYSTFVSAINHSEVHAMFKKALDQTEQHLETIEAEYARSMGMVDDTEINTYVRE